MRTRTVAGDIMTDRKPASEPLTLAIDIGGSHLKAGILNASGEMTKGPVHVMTPKPALPAAVVEALANVVKQLGPYDRVSIGFPGVVRGVAVLTAPNLGTKAWRRFPLASAMQQRLGHPVRMLNDASVQGLGAITGRGVECVLTMGTGMGFALFNNGRIAPHLELSQHPVHNDKTYDQYVGNAALTAIGPRRWNKRMRRVIGLIATLANYDMLYIGGGNARLIKPPLPGNVTLVPNEDGITGGVRLWDKKMDEAFVDSASQPLGVQA